MSFARAISRGAFLKARFGVNGTKNASRSFGTVGASRRVASDIFISPASDVCGVCLPLYQPFAVCGMPAGESVRGCGERPNIHLSGIVHSRGLEKIHSNINVEQTTCS